MLSVYEMSNSITKKTSGVRSVARVKLDTTAGGRAARRWCKIEGMRGLFVGMILRAFHHTLYSRRRGALH